MTAANPTNILVIGQGDIGNPVTNQLAQQDQQVTGLARRERSNYRLDDKVGFLQEDALKLKAEQINDFTHIAIIVTPDQYDVEAYKNTYFGIAQHIAELADDLPKLKRVVFISSTGVYGQDDGEWIDASVQPVAPKREASTYILKAEQVLQQTYGDRAVIIRPSGIYGEERLMRVRKAQEADKSSMPKHAWTNRIMDSDLITIIANVLMLDAEEVQPVYLATDYDPVTSYEIAQWLCEKLDTTVPEIDDITTVSGKRLHSNIPLAWLTYPDWQSGYRYILQHL